MRIPDADVPVPEPIEVFHLLLGSKVVVMGEPLESPDSVAAKSHAPFRVFVLKLKIGVLCGQRVVKREGRGPGRDKGGFEAPVYRSKIEILSFRRCNPASSPVLLNPVGCNRVGLWNIGIEIERL